MLRLQKLYLQYFCCSNHHQDPAGWHDYKTMLQSRCLLAALIKFSAYLAMLVTDSEPTQRYDKFMESDASENFEKNDFEPLKYLLRGLIAIRLPLFLLVAKYPQIVKAMHFFETVILILEQLLPQRSVMEDPGIVNLIWMISTIANFALFYCNFWVSFITCALSQIVLQKSQAAVYQRENIDTQVVAILVYLCWLIISLALMNYICIQIGTNLRT